MEIIPRMSVLFVPLSEQVTAISYLQISFKGYRLSKSSA